MPGDNFNFRRILRRGIDSLLDRALPPPTKKTAPTVDSKAAEKAAETTAMQAMQGAHNAIQAKLKEERSAPYEAPIVPGTGRRWGGSNLKGAVNQTQQRLFSSREAQRGRALSLTGPSAQSQEQSPDLDLPYIAAVRSQVQRSGWMYQKADLDARLLREDPQLAQCDRSRRAAFYKARHTIAPKDETRLSYLVCNACEGILDELDGFDSSMAALGIANGSGIAMQEVVYKPLRLRIVTGPRQSFIVDSEGVEALHPIPNRSLAYDIDQEDEPYILQGAFDPIDPFHDPETGEVLRKVMYHRGFGDSLPRTRGYMTAAHPLCYLKNLSMERLGVLVETFALSTPYLQNPAENNATDEDLIDGRDALADIGKGIPAVIPGIFGEVKSTPVPANMTPIQSFAIGIVDAAISKLVTSQTLSSEAGGVGSYALGNVHADEKEDTQQIDLSLASTTERTQLIRFIVDINAERWARAFASYCPGEECTPDAIRRCLPKVRWVLNRKVDPVARLKMFCDGKDAGMLIDSGQVYEEANFRRAGGKESAFGYEADAQPAEPSPQMDPPNQPGSTEHSEDEEPGEDDAARISSEMAAPIPTAESK